MTDASNQSRLSRRSLLASLATMPAVLVAGSSRAAQTAGDAALKEVQAALRDARGTKLVLLGTAVGPISTVPGHTRHMTSHVMVSNAGAYVLDCAQSLNAFRAAYSKYGSRGYWSKLRELLLPRFRTNPIGWYRLAEINTYLGDKEEALRWLQKAYDERPNWIPFIKVDPSLDPLRSDPRFPALLRGMGL